VLLCCLALHFSATQLVYEVLFPSAALQCSTISLSKYVGTKSYERICNLPINQHVAKQLSVIKQSSDCLLLFAVTVDMVSASQRLHYMLNYWYVYNLLCYLFQYLATTFIFSHQMRLFCIVILFTILWKNVKVGQHLAQLRTTFGVCSRTLFWLTV